MPASTLSKKHCRDVACSISVDGIADDGSAEVMKEQILDLELFEDGDRALIAVDIAELSRIFADDYVQYDESGRAFSKQDLVNNLSSSAIRYIARRSTGRRIRLLGEDVTIVHGSEEDEIEQGGKRPLIRYVYTDIVMGRDGKWQSEASQLARPVEAQAEREWEL